jgi:hypothetical protein
MHVKVKDLVRRLATQGKPADDRPQTKDALTALNMPWQDSKTRAITASDRDLLSFADTASTEHWAAQHTASDPLRPAGLARARLAT